MGGELASHPASLPPPRARGSSVIGLDVELVPVPRSGRGASQVTKRATLWAEGPPLGSTCFQALRQSLGAGLGHGQLHPSPHPRLLPPTLKLCSRQRAPKGCVAAFWTKGRAAGLPNCWPTAFTPQAISGEAGPPGSVYGAKPWMWGRARLPEWLDEAGRQRITFVMVQTCPVQHLERS